MYVAQLPTPNSIKGQNNTILGGKDIRDYSALKHRVYTYLVYSDAEVDESTFLVFNVTHFLTQDALVYEHWFIPTVGQEDVSYSETLVINFINAIETDTYYDSDTEDYYDVPPWDLP